MLVGICSAKGSPGVTAATLALTASWPRPVVLVEADPTGGDLAYRCRATSGGPVYATPNLLTLAAAIRAGVPGPSVLVENSQRLRCGVDLVQGVTAPTQACGLGSLWSMLAQACQESGVDVVADLGRLDRTSVALPLAQAADCVLTVASSSLEAVMHLRAGLGELVGVLNAHQEATIVPVIVGADTHAAGDCADLDGVLSGAGLPVQASGHLPYDPKALERLERGEPATGRLGRTLLIRAAKAMTGTILDRAGEADVA